MIAFFDQNQYLRLEGDEDAAGAAAEFAFAAEAR